MWQGFRQVVLVYIYVGLLLYHAKVLKISVRQFLDRLHISYPIVDESARSQQLAIENSSFL